MSKLFAGKHMAPPVDTSWRLPRTGHIIVPGWTGAVIGLRAPMRPYYQACRFACQWFYVLCFRGRVFGLHRVPKTGGVLLVSNHQSYLDPVLVTLALPREGNYMARASLFGNRLFRGLIVSLNAFPIRPGTADISAVKEVLRRLRDGKLVVAFPEGTRSEDGRIRPFHAGVASIAMKAHVPIVPTLIEGAFDAWPRRHKLPRPANVWVEYGEPLIAPPRSQTDAEQFAAELADRLRAMQSALRARLGRQALQYDDQQPSASSGAAAATDKP